MADQCDMQRADQAELQPIIDQFKQMYGVPPSAVSRAPGRVNLIGEHIDYEGYGVMPMAINQACLVAAAWQQPSSSGSGSTGGGTDANAASSSAASDSSYPQQTAVMHVANVQQQLYPAGQLPLDPTGQLPADCPGWLKYVHAAYKGCVEFAGSKQLQVPTGGILLLAHGSVPQGSGLSSSSALVVASALALLALWQIPASPQEVAEFTCRCERHVGTQGGGMDQAVSLMAQPGVAMHVEFNPVRASAVPLPAGGVFVVANSLATSLKAEKASSRFNLRVLECRLAAMLLAKQLTAGLLNWQQVKVLCEVEHHLLSFGASAATATAGESETQQQLQDDTAAQLSRAVQQLLPETSYQLQQVVDLLGCTQPQLMALLPPALQQAAVQAPNLLLQQRCLHVFSEARRVLQFKHVCLDDQLMAGQKLSQLGALMDGSHASCAGLYCCSCDELDRLVAVAKGAGALGARLTGAGWGGCVVALVEAGHVDEFIARVRQEYFKPVLADGSLQGEEQPAVQRYLFATVPAGGASVVLM